jgi:sporulation protein YlmC with PRC-barrel domain
MNEREQVSESAGTDAVAAGMSESSQPLSPKKRGVRGEEGARVIPASDEDHSGPGPRVMAASTLAGDDVVNAAGDKLGTLDEIMLDVPSGRIAYAVLSSGGFLGVGDKLFAIPWRALTLDAENKCFILDVSKERLEQAPGFDDDHWPTMADESWAREMHTYYRVRPYWE